MAADLKDDQPASAIDTGAIEQWLNQNIGEVTSIELQPRWRPMWCADVRRGDESLKLCVRATGSTRSRRSRFPRDDRPEADAGPWRRCPPRSRMDQFTDNYRELKARPDPFVEFVLGYLDRNLVGASERRTLIVCDEGQFLQVEGCVQAVTDLEVAHLGDPMADLGMLASRDPTMHFGKHEAAFRLGRGVFGHQHRYGGDPDASSVRPADMPAVVPRGAREPAGRLALLEQSEVGLCEQLRHDRRARSADGYRSVGGGASRAAQLAVAGGACTHEQPAQDAQARRPV